jgi:hypothetical protein
MTPMRATVAVLVVLAVVILDADQKSHSARGFNIVPVITDEEEYGDVGHHGASDNNMTNVDPLARKGVRFTRRR